MKNQPPNKHICEETSQLHKQPKTINEVKKIPNIKTKRIVFRIENKHKCCYSYIESWHFNRQTTAYDHPLLQQRLWSASFRWKPIFSSWTPQRKEESCFLAKQIVRFLASAARSPACLCPSQISVSFLRWIRNQQQRSSFFHHQMKMKTRKRSRRWNSEIWGSKLQKKKRFSPAGAKSRIRNQFSNRFGPKADVVAVLRRVKTAYWADSSQKKWFWQLTWRNQSSASKIK